MLIAAHKATIRELRQEGQSTDLEEKMLKMEGSLCAFRAYLAQLAN